MLSSLGNSTYLGLSLAVDFTKIDPMMLTHVRTTYCLICERWVPTKLVHVTQVIYRTCAASACVITCSEWSLIFSMMMTTPITNQYLKHESPGPVTCATACACDCVCTCSCDCTCLWLWLCLWQEKVGSQPWPWLLRDFTQYTTLHGVRFLTLHTRFIFRKYVINSGV